MIMKAIEKKNEENINNLLKITKIVTLKYINNVLQTHCVTVVHIELMSWYDECKYVKTGSNPTVICVQRILFIGYAVEILHFFKLFFFIEGQVFNQRYTSDVVEKSHHDQLDYSPNADDNPAQGQFGSAEFHDVRFECATLRYLFRLKIWCEKMKLLISRIQIRVHLNTLKVVNNYCNL